MDRWQNEIQYYTTQFLFRINQWCPKAQLFPFVCYEHLRILNLEIPKNLGDIAHFFKLYGDNFENTKQSHYEDLP